MNHQQIIIGLDYWTLYKRAKFDMMSIAYS